MHLVRDVWSLYSGPAKSYTALHTVVRHVVNIYVKRFAAWCYSICRGNIRHRKLVTRLGKLYREYCERFVFISWTQDIVIHRIVIEFVVHAK